jgi:hypothetical protein
MFFVFPMVTNILPTHYPPQDTLGLRSLDERGALHHEMLPGMHMHVTLDALDGLVERYFD